jgi:hypothetical protein
VHARKRGVESFEKREKDVKRGNNKEKSMSILVVKRGVPLNLACVAKRVPRHMLVIGVPRVMDGRC